MRHWTGHMAKVQSEVTWHWCFRKGFWFCLLSVCNSSIENFLFFVNVQWSWPLTLNVILMVPQLVSSLDVRLNSSGELGDTSGAGRYQFFLEIHQHMIEIKKKLTAAQMQKATLLNKEHKNLCYWLAEKFHRQVPGVTTEGSVFTAMGANTVVDVGDVRCDVLYACVVKTVDPKTWVSALHLALEIVEGPCCMLQRMDKTCKNISFL